MEVTILGAGLAGLAAAHDLTLAGHRVTLFEKDTRVGGMATSFRVGPYWLDHGPHRFYSRSEELIQHVYDVLDGDVVVRQRMSRIFLRERFFDYPLRLGNVLRNLPMSLLARAGWDYARARTRQKLRPEPDDDFESWVVQRFGRTLYELFFGAYTEKAWGMAPARISADWASQRISQKSLWDAIKRTIRPPRDGEVRGLVREFYYPKNGGIGALARRYAEKIEARGGRILLGTKVNQIDAPDGRVQSITYQQAGVTHEHRTSRIISTIPLPALLRSLRPSPPAEALRASGQLDYIAILFVYLEIDRPSAIPDHWIYLPEKDLRVHRVSEFKNFSDSVAPGDRTALCCEITCRAGDKTWRLTSEQAAAIAIADLERIGLIEPGSAQPLTIARLSHAYPVYDLDYKRKLRALLSAVREPDGLISTGRQGLFRYNNMDHSIAMGRKAARTVMGSVPADETLVGSEAEYYG